MLKKFNWGHGILLFFSSFVAAMLYLVYLCTGESRELVSNNYYSDEIRYQQIIDQKNNANAMANPVQFKYEAGGGNAMLMFPDNMGTVKNLAVHFYKPDQENLDKVVTFAQLQGNIQQIDVSTFKSGYWKVETTWESQSKKYFKEFVFDK